MNLLKNRKTRKQVLGLIDSSSNSVIINPDLFGKVEPEKLTTPKRFTCSNGEMKRFVTN